MTSAVSWSEDIRPVAACRPLARPRMSAQRLIITLFGYLWRDEPRYLPTGAVVELLGDFGISGSAAHTALSRLARRGFLETSRSGRNTFYRLDRVTADRAERGADRIQSFGSHDNWDRKWCLVTFSLPEDLRDLRHSFRTRLQWIGFAPLYYGTWIAPGSKQEMVQRDIQDLGITDATVFLVDHDNVHSNGRPPLAAWNLEPVKDSYLDFIAWAEGIWERAARGTMGPAEASVSRAELMDAFGKFPSVDPEVPLDMMPEGWPRAEARAVFTSSMEALRELADIRMEQTLLKYGVTPAPLP